MNLKGIFRELLHFQPALCQFNKQNKKNSQKKIFMLIYGNPKPYICFCFERQIFMWRLSLSLPCRCCGWPCSPEQTCSCMHKACRWLTLLHLSWLHSFLEVLQVGLSCENVSVSGLNSFRGTAKEEGAVLLCFSLSSCSLLIASGRAFVFTCIQLAILDSPSSNRILALIMHFKRGLCKTAPYCYKGVLLWL